MKATEKEILNAKNTMVLETTRKKRKMEKVGALMVVA